MPKQPNRIADSPWVYRAYVLVALACGVLSAVYGQPLIHDNSEASGIIVTVFSILAGFLVAVMSLLGDQSIIPGSWRFGREQKRRIRAKLIRQKWLFYLYLSTLVAIFLSSLIRKTLPDETIYLEYAYLGLSTFAFLLSFKLPSTLMEVQSDRIEAVIESRKKDASILERN